MKKQDHFSTLPRFSYTLTLFFLTAFLFSTSVHAATYYLTEAGKASAQTPGGWNTIAAGGGTAASDFTTDVDIFIIPANIDATVSANWDFGFDAQGGQRSLSLQVYGSLTFNSGVVLTLRVKNSGETVLEVFDGAELIFLGTTAQIVGNTVGSASSTNIPVSVNDGATISTAHPDGALGSFNLADINLTLGDVGYAYTGSGTISIPASTINGDLTVGGTTTLTATGALDINGNLIVESGASFNAGSFTHTISGYIDIDGAFLAGTSTIVMDGNTTQTIDVLNHASNPFNNLTINKDAGFGVKGSSDFTVNGILNLQSDNPNETDGTLDMVVDYGTGEDGYLGYAATLPKDGEINTTNLTNQYTQAGDILNSNILYMGPVSTTIGQGDVIGKIKRTSFSSNVEYTFGNPHSSMAFSVPPDEVAPSSVMFVVTKGPKGVHPNSPYKIPLVLNDGVYAKVDGYNAVRRLYQIIRNGGSSNCKVSLKLHYRDDERLSPPSPSNLVLWDHHIHYSTNNTPHEHGKTGESMSIDSKYIQLNGHAITYFATGNDFGEDAVGVFGKYWIIAEKLSPSKQWLAAAGSTPEEQNNWFYASNWTDGVLPSSGDNLTIPPSSVATVSPVINNTNATAKSITIEGSDQTVTINSGIKLSLEGGVKFNGGVGTINGVGTVIGVDASSILEFDFPRTDSTELATFSGLGELGSIELTGNTHLEIQTGANIELKGGISLATGAVFDAGTQPNTITYLGTAAVISPNGGDGSYHSLGFGEDAAPASVPATIAMKGNYTNEKSGLSLNTTLSLVGNTEQTLGGTQASTFTGLTVNNAAGVNITRDQNISGTLTLTNGVVSTSNAALKLGASASIAGTPGVSAHINGKLTRAYNATGEKVFPVGKGAKYRPVKLNFSALTGSSEVSVEQFEAAFGVALPAGYESRGNRYWNVAETGSSSRTYTISLTGGDDFIPSNTQLVRILKYNGSTWATSNTTYNSETGYYTSTTGFSDFSDFLLAESLITWDGSESTDWNTAANWDLNLVPPDGASIIIPNVTNQPVLSGSASLTNCTIDANASLTIATSGKLTVEGTLTNNAGLSGILIKSDATGTGSLIARNAVTASMERYIEGLGSNWDNLLYAANGWHMLSSPVSGQAISGSWTPTGESGDYDFYAWNTYQNLWFNWKNETTWTAIPDTDPVKSYGSDFNPGQGYLIAYENTSTKIFEGTLNVTDHAIDSIRSHYFPAVGENPAYRLPWHLIGNPYSSGLEWNNVDWQLNRIAGVAKVWNRANSSYTDFGKNSIIPPTNAFMIKVEGSGESTTSGSLLIPASARVHYSASDSPSFYKSANEGFRMVMYNPLNRTAQESSFYIHPESTEAYDSRFDSEFLPGYGPYFYAEAAGKRLSTHVVPEIHSNSFIPYSFVVHASGSYEIRLDDVQNFTEDIWIYDKKLSKDYSLSYYKSYAFSADEGDASDRFIVHFGNIDLEEIIHPKPITAWYHNQQLHIKTEVNQTSVKVFDLSGKEVFSTLINGKGTHMLPFIKKSGVFLVRTSGDSYIYSTKIVII